MFKISELETKMNLFIAYYFLLSVLLSPQRISQSTRSSTKAFLSGWSSTSEKVALVPLITFQTKDMPTCLMQPLDWPPHNRRVFLGAISETEAHLCTAGAVLVVAVGTFCTAPAAEGFGECLSPTEGMPSAAAGAGECLFRAPGAGRLRRPEEKLPFTCRGKYNITLHSLLDSF